MVIESEALRINIKPYSEVIEEPPIKIKPVQGKRDELSLEWEKKEGAIKYQIFGSYSLFGEKKLIGTSPQNKANIKVPLLMLNIFPSFWVKVIYEKGEEWLNDIGISYEIKDPFVEAPLTQEVKELYIIDDPEMKYYCEEMRRRLFAILDNHGEPFLYFHRRWAGTPCDVCLPSEGEEFIYTPLTRCPKCFGNGFIGGFYPPFLIKLIYVVDQIGISLREMGILTELRGRCISPWIPFVREFDMVENIKTGERFYISTPRRGCGLRGITLSHDFDLRALPPGHFWYTVTKEKILEFDPEYYDFSFLGWD